MKKLRIAPPRTGSVPADESARRKRMIGLLQKSAGGLSRAPKQGTVRVFHPVEVARLAGGARGLLYKLSARGVLSHRLREEAVNVAMWLEQPEITESDMDEILRFLADRGTDPAAIRNTHSPSDNAADGEGDPSRWN